MIKELLFSEDAQSKIEKGVEKLAKAVAVTMGPKGRNVIIEHEDDIPHITKDGVTVAKNIELENQYENIGAQLVKEVAIKTANEAGDGTTTSTVLAHTIFKEGRRVIRENNLNPILFKREFDKLVLKVSNFIRSQAIEIKDDLVKIKNVASISANNDDEIGNLIANSVKEAGTDGIILIEETTNSETTIEVVKGLQIEKGYESHYFMTDPIKMICEFENPLVFLYDKKINKLRDIYHILEISVKENRPLVIIADDYESEVLSTLIANNMNGAIKVCALRIPGFGINRIGIMEDLAISTGATYIREEKGLFLKDVNRSHLGGCNKFQANKEASLIIEGHGDYEEIFQRIKELRAMTLNEQSAHITEGIYERLAKLAGGVVIIKVGANSDLELKEKRDRIDDALSATRAAIAEGIVPGAGSTYIRASGYIEIDDEENIIQQCAREVIIIALQSIFKQICKNAGLEFVDDYIIMRHFDDGKIGLNLMTEELCDLVEAGVIDPAKVERVAFENAANIASLFLTTDCIIINKK